MKLSLNKVLILAVIVTTISVFIYILSLNRKISKLEEDSVGSYKTQRIELMKAINTLGRKNDSLQEIETQLNNTRDSLIDRVSRIDSSWKEKSKKYEKERIIINSGNANDVAKFLSSR